MDTAIELSDLRKVFRVRERAPGMASAVRQLFRAPVREVLAVDGISFRVQQGLSDRILIIENGPVKRRPTLIVLSVDIRAVRNQQIGNSRIVESTMQRPILVSIPSVYICPRSNQQTGDVRITAALLVQ